MICPNCKSDQIETRMVNSKPVYQYTCSGLHSRINEVVVHKEYFCKKCHHSWK